MIRATLMRMARRWHARLRWPAGIALVCWVVSGITHPLMVWTGPQAENMRPPQLSFDVDTWRENLPALSGLVITEAAVVPTAQGAMLRTSGTTDAEVTYWQHGNLQNYSDRDQATWLSRHYLGTERTNPDALESVTLVTEFSPNYPAVNRLLPVWRVEYSGSLHAFVHTETASLALIGNNQKQALQRVFQWLHTHSYLSHWPWLQFLVSLILVVSLLVFALAGTVLVFAMPKRRSIQPAARRWHRRGALLLYVPLLALSLSGFYHLVYTHFDDTVPGQLQLATPALYAGDLDALLAGLQPFDGVDVQQSSLVTTLDGETYIRLQHTRADAPQTREDRFVGHAAYQQVTYIGQGAATNDESVARAYATTVREDEPQNIQQINRFGGLYDFRNKRLPVWQATYVDEVIFIDPARQVLIERVSRPEQWERWSFSTLHKWNFMTPFIGRNNRDILLLTLLCGFLLMLVAGVLIARSRRP